MAFKLTHFKRLALLGAVVCLAGCPTGTPLLSVIPTIINFGDTAITDSFTVTNLGAGTLEWSVTGAPAWLEVTPAQGTLTEGRNQRTTLRAVRSAVPTPGNYSAQLTVNSNGGSSVVTVTLQTAGPQTPPDVDLTPDSLAFGSADQLALTIANAGGQTLNWTITEDIDWLSASQVAGQATSTTPSSVTFTVNRAGLATGTYTDDFVVSTNDEDVTVTVTMDVTDSMPIIDASTNSLTFDLTDTETEFTIANTGSGTLDWSIATAVTTVGNWLEVAPATGSTATDPTTVTVRAVRSNLTPADYPAATTDFTGTITITSNTTDGNDPVVINVTMTTRPTTLLVTPTDVDFRTTITNKLLSISNPGVGSIDWEITEDIPWLTLSPNPAQGTHTTGEPPDAVVLTVNRGGMTDGASLEDSFTVTATDDLGNPLSPVTVNVKVKAPDQPILSVEVYVEVTGQGLQLSVTNEDPPKPYMNFDDETTQLTVYIRNSGNSGTVNWNFDLETLPAWITNISKVQGSLLPDDDPTDSDLKADEVVITVDRTGLASGGYPYDLLVESNAGSQVIRISMNVPKIVSIGTDVNSLNLGQDATVGAFSAANFGDAGTVLNFRVYSDQEWLFHSPQTGTSIGTPTPPPFKDWKTINLAVDRAGMDGKAATGIFDVYAIEFGEGGVERIDEDIEPRQVVVTVEPIPLSIRAPLARLRIPSQVRWPMLLKDFKDRAITDDPLDIGADSFTIMENSEFVQTEETEQFLTDGSHLKYHMVLMLDYSGSMLNSAMASGLSGADPLQDMYAGNLDLPGLDAKEVLPSGIAGDFLTAFASNYRLALMEFHDRSRATTLTQDFTENQATLLAALNAISIEDHGASPLLPAVDAAVIAHAAEDAPLLPFDDADVRVIAIISDGRVTTPSGDAAATIQDTIDLANAARVQIFAIGWGSVVNHEPLARLASETGGNYYPVKPELIPATDPAYDPTKPTAVRPSLTNLAKAVRRMQGDLKAMVALSYTTLNEEPNVDVMVNAAFNPQETNPPTPSDELDEGIVTGRLSQILSFSGIAGDVRMGHLSLRTSGIQADGTARAVIRAEYIPRNINKFRFTLTSAPAFDSIDIVSPEDGGLLFTRDYGPDPDNPLDPPIIHEWTLTDEGGGTYLVEADPPNTDDVLPYGSFGDMLELLFTGLNPADDFELTFDFDNTTYLADIEPKYFLTPDRLRIHSDSFFAPAFPTPLTDPTTIDFGSNPTNNPAADIMTFTLRNIGGSYLGVTPGIRLYWSIEDTPNFLAIAPESGELTSGFEQATIVVAVDRTQAAGLQTALLPIAYETGALGIQGSTTVLITATILNPVLSVSTNTVNFPAGIDTTTFEISNTGQSTLEWRIFNAAPWLTFSSSSGSATNTSSSEIDLDVDRTGLAAGVYTGTFTVATPVGTETVTVNLTVP